jgi:hypothetical protein
MSFFDDASLAFLPSGAAGKDGKAYSIKPTDGTGDFTFSRGSNLAATRVGADGLIEKGRENLLTYSNDFSQWTKSGATATGGQSGYDGSSDAWLITKSGGAFDQVLRNVSSSGVNTISFYAKAGTLTSVYFRGQASSNIPDVKFNLSDGSLTSSNNVISASSEDIGSGWYRLKITFSNTITNVTIYPDFGQTTAGTIYIQDAQVEIGLAATDYIESGATTGKAGLLEDEPRFDYSGGATCPSLLLEPSRTNLVEQSEYLGDNSNSNCTIDTNDATSPDGLTTASKVIGSGTDIFIRTRQSVSVPSAGAYIFSLFAKKGNVTKVEIRALTYSGSTGVTEAKFDLEAGTALTTGAFIEDYGNGWYKCSTPVTIDAGDLSGSLSVYAIGSNGSIIYSSNADTNGEYFYTWGWFVEAGSYPTSYIPNHSGGTITRGGEASSVMDVPNFTGNPSVSLFVDLGEWKGSDINNSNIYLASSSFSQQIQIRIRPDGIRVYLSNINGTDQYLNLPVTTASKILVKYDGNEYVLFINGVEIQSAASVGDSKYEKLYFNGYSTTLINKLLLFPEALSDADCITLTT